MSSITLASTWNPRGELGRLQRLLPRLGQVYAHLVIVLKPGVDAGLAESLAQAGCRVFTPPEWSGGRLMALTQALETDAAHIHYADMDRLLRWIETRPQEWQTALQALVQTDYLLMGRTARAYATHPRALVETERISNRVVSQLVGQAVDVSAGSKGFSRRAAEFLAANGQPGFALGTDGEWTVLLQRAGFDWQYLECDGLDWESADRYQDAAADDAQQAQSAAAYDADPGHWAYRSEVALEVVEQALAASRKIIPQAARREPGQAQPEFDFEAVFDADDYQYYYADSLTDERTEKEVAALLPLLELERPMRILDLACGFGRHANRLAALGHSLVGVDLVPGFIEAARADAQQRGVQVDYRQGDMRHITFENEFERVLLLFTAFGYFEDDENLLVLQNAARALKPGGLLLFDTHNRDVFARWAQPAMVQEKDGNLLIDRTSFDTLSGRWYNKRILIRDGVRKDMPFFVRFYNPTEILALLAQAGLALAHFYGSWDGQPLSSDSRRMIVIARKP